jgi:NodT family efflux transporter outer membrane factor (OMF) lipoprotein
MLSIDCFPISWTISLFGATTLKSLCKSPASLRWQRIVITVSATLLAACAVGPDFKQPTAPDAKTYTPTPIGDSTAVAPGPGGDAQHFMMGRDIPFAWWVQFQSPKLNALVERSLKENPDITAAQAALRQAQEYTAAQRGFFYPTVSAQFTPERQKLSGNTGGNSPGIQGNGTTISTYQNPSGTAPFNGPTYFNFYTAQLALSYTPDAFGSNRRQVESLKAQEEALRFEMEATYITLASNVVAAAIQEASLKSQIDATKAFIDQNAKAVDILHNQLRVGYAMGIDVATQEAALAQAKALLPPLQKQLEQTHDLIRALCGNLPNEALDDDFDLAALHLPEDLPVSLPSKLVEQRPDIRAAEEQLHSASAQVGVAVAARLPQFDITAAIGGNASQIPQMFTTGGPFWSLIGGITQPIFDGGTLSHKQSAAEQGLIQARAQYRSTVITAFQNVADTLHAIQSDADGLAAAAESERAAKVVMTLTEKQHELGYVDFLTQLAAEETHQQALVNLLQARTNRYGDTAALFQALGGGWWNRPHSDTAGGDTPTKLAAVDSQ